MIEEFIKCYCFALCIGKFLNINIVSNQCNIEITTYDNDVIVEIPYIYILILLRSCLECEANLTYDEEILEYKGSVSFITGSSSFLR